MNKQSIEQALAHLDNLEDHQIDYTDSPALDDSFFQRPFFKGSPLPTSDPCWMLSFQVDTDLLDWLKGQKQEYSSLINTLLRQYREQHS